MYNSISALYTCILYSIVNQLYADKNEIIF